MTANVNAMVRAGVDAYRAGKADEARTLLERAIDLDSYNETAWLWLSAVVESNEEKQTCLENVLVINPDNERAKQGLQSLGIDPTAVASDEELPAIPPFAESDELDPYAVPSSSASVDHASIAQPSADDYDDWVQGLNLGGSDDEAPATTSVMESSDATFSDDLFSDDIDFTADDSHFDLDESLFADDDDDLYDDDDIMSEEYSQIDSVGIVDDALFSDVDSADEDLHFDDGDDLYADKNMLDDFNEAIDTVTEYDDKLFSKDPYAPEPVKEDIQLTPEFLFAQIPQEVEATRLPGVREAIPTMHYVILGVLGLLNVAALLFVGSQFIG